MLFRTLFNTTKKPEGYWEGFFDALDVNRDGQLSRQEFWIQWGTNGINTNGIL